MNERPRTIHAGAPYGTALLPYLALSLLLHGLMVGGIAFRNLAKMDRGSSFAMESFGKPAGSTPPGTELATEIERDRPRRYRLNYFNRVVLPQPELIAALPELPVEPDVPAALDPPIKPTPTPVDPTPAPVDPTPVEDGVSNGGDPDAPPNTSVDIGFLDGEDGESMKVPPFVLHTLMDDVYRTERDFLQYPTIFIVSDISTKRGLDDLMNWSHFFHDLLHLPNIVTPPYILGIGESLEDPYFLPVDAAEYSLKTRWDKLGLYTGHVWGDVAFDAKQEFVDGVGVEELPDPQIYMIDLDGYIRIRITGRLEDLSTEEITRIATEIRDQWQMSAMEFQAAKIIIFQWQSALKNGTLGAPTRSTPGRTPEAIPPGLTEPPEA